MFAEGGAARERVERNKRKNPSERIIFLEQLVRKTDFTFPKSMPKNNTKNRNMPSRWTGTEGDWRGIFEQKKKPYRAFIVLVGDL